MKRWYRGSRRIVLALPNYGIAVKFPLLRTKNIWDFWMGDVVGMYKEMYASAHPEARALYREAVWLGFKRCMYQCFFGGLADNWRERHYYKYCDASLRPLLQPTYLSLIGLVNLQRLGTPSNDEAVCRRTCRVIRPDAPRDGHHWDMPTNFDVSAGCLKMLDYGSTATQKIINKHGLALLAEFGSPV